MSGVVIVYVHGLWLPGHEAFLLRRRLSAALAAQTRLFTYSSLGADLTENATALNRCLCQTGADTLHLVAHSLGGLVVLKAFELGAKGLPPGRIVLLGAPVRGCRAAQRLARLPMGRSLMGRAAEALVTSRERRWDGARDLGVIAGDLPLGIGRLMGPMRAPNDGTVLVSETDLPGATQQFLLRVCHSGMPFSAAVARQTAQFLRAGRFEK
jgi:pimeloyl-ACP methyl ester carboxylesterase